MSYEKKIRDLMARLVSMSPEPLPYPEEMPMAAKEASSRKPHPALVFAGAVALVALLAVPVILLTGGEIPLAGDTTTTTVTPQTSTSEQVTSTTVVPSTTTTDQTPSTAAPVSTWQGVVYLYQTPENSFLGNPSLVPIDVDVTDPSAQLTADAPFTEALGAIDESLPPSLGNAIPADVRILALQQDDSGFIWADMNQAFLDGAGGLLADITMLNQIVYTLTADFVPVPGLTGDYETHVGVLFTVNGEPVEAFGTEGLDLTSQIDRRTFLDDYIGLIFLTEPIVEFEHIYSVSGLANTYEASLSVRVVDGDGNTVHEEPVQATCGTGCWGEFGVGVSSDLVVPGESSIQLFAYSAEDGSMSDVITIPIFENDVWSVTLD